MKLDLYTVAETKDSTASQLLVDGHFQCFVLEDGYRHSKEPGVTRIPPGVYRLEPRFYGGFYQRYKKRYGHDYVWELMDVPNFTDILIHIGNWVGNTRGCLLTGNKLGRSGDNWAVYQSANAYKRLFEALPCDTHEIHIHREL